MRLYDDIDTGEIARTRKVGRHLFMALEHEAEHAETLLYMLLQRAGTGTIPPPGFAIPHWNSLKAYWDLLPPPQSETVTLGPATVTLGHDDSEIGDESDTNFENHEFGWDNEHPQRNVEVGQFKISWRPVTNGELYGFYVGQGKDKIKLPATWVMEGDDIKVSCSETFFKSLVIGEMQVRTLYGPVSMDIAQHWPVIAPYKTLSIYATVKGGRLPTEAELRLFYDKFECDYASGANVGFRNWHPIPSVVSLFNLLIPFMRPFRATTGGEKDQGKGINGGVWEWTSTLMDFVEGYSVSSIYPG
jgi:formylglycine-generating enzyme required for sulfatase activity